jgi:ribonucleoside-diphosphate reductase alpha chain
MADQLQNIITEEPAPELLNHLPGQLRVIRRNGSVVPYNDSKIAIALTKAFIAVEGNQAAASDRVREQVHTIVTQMSEDFLRRAPSSGHLIHIETIQDKVELALMRIGAHQVAREYVLYREEHRKIREQKTPESPSNVLNIILADGAKIPLNLQRLAEIVNEACVSLQDVDADAIIKETLRNLYDGASMEDVNKALIMSARVMIEKEPNYSFVAARLLLNDLRREALNFLAISNEATQAELAQSYPEAFERYIERGIELEMLDPALKGSFDFKALGNALVSDRDLQFTYLGLQTLYDRYFIHHKGIRYELPQVFFMRVAMGLALNETSDKTQRAIEFYNVLSKFDYMSSTPTLFNSATRRPQLSSCFLTTIPDDLEGIYNALKDNALLSKFAGGLGNDWTQVRALGAHIKGTNGKSLGPVPFMKVADSTAIAVNQGGKRKGAVCAYFEAWHMDIFELLELRKNTGDDRRRTHDMNTAIWVPDLLVKRKIENQDWTLFSPNEVPDLHDKYGLEFEKAYIAYEEKAKRGEITGKTIPAISLWRKMLSMLFETGHPWITFKDTCNLRSPQQHAGVIHSSNLCTEITLNTSADEIAVCNLGSINLVQHLNDQGLDHEKLKRTIKTAIRMLDNVIDINFYPVPQARKSNLKHRPIGMGLMGFQDALYKLRIPYSSDEAVKFADESMEAISYYAIMASSELAEERGSYQSYEGSLWSKSILPIDSIGILQQARGEYLQQNRSSTLDWDLLRTRVATAGMRNSNVMAIAPTATISNICGVAQSIEPTYQNLYVKSNLSGEFTVVNPYLVNDLKAAGLWDEVMITDLKYYDGSLQKINRIPNELKVLYATAFEIDANWLVEAGSRRQKWIDQSQSLNIYMAKPSGKKLDAIYTMAWLLGLKTTYYLRSLGATNAEKSTISDGALNAVDITPKVCSIDDPDCEACQ